MTSRLKRKLENIGVDVQSKSSKLTENFCLIGTPLPPLEKAKDTGEFIPLWKQEVRDEQGRRRLHGAFTGGFSAGYYNTVGSKEGWVPSTFTSSRTDRASKKKAKPEDFMDEEDLAELRDSKKLVDTTEETDLMGGTQAELARRRGEGEFEKDSITSALEALLPPSKDSVGAQLLKKMGWRPGQGIGPRVTYKQLRAQDGQPIMAGEHIDEEASKHLYAPRDTKTVTYHRKDNAFGLGFTPGQRLGEITQGRNGQAIATGPKLSAGFGLGALNDAEDDDVDVYDQGLAREGRRMAYDAGDIEGDESVTLHAKKPDKALTKNAIVLSGTFRDGRPVVSGFILFGQPLIEDRWFAMPDVPKGWTPDPRRVWTTDGNEQERASRVPGPQDHRSWLKGKTADERGSMLGETPLPGAPRSVFDYLSQKDRDRLKNLAASLESGSLKQTHPLPPASAPAPPPPPPISIPRTESHTAQAALKGFQPFTREPRKQERYTVYLQSQADASSSAPALLPLPGQSNDEFNKEAAEYAQAALIFKPVSGAMAGRFASASTMEMIGSTNQGLHRPTKEDYARLDVPVEQEEEKQGRGKEAVQESPKVHAARLGMFGVLTRESKVWQPARLLCKRFGVKDPHPDGVVESGTAGEAGNVAANGKAQAWQAEVLPPGGVPNTGASTALVEGAGTTSPPPGKRDLANIGLGEDEAQGKDTLTYERPAKDIFKAIFASDDEESDDEADDIVDGLGGEYGVPAATAAPAAPSVPQALEKVDLATFRPTFVPKGERAKDREGKAKKEREKKKRGKIVVSFDVEEEGPVDKKNERRKGKRRKKEREPVGDRDDDEGMWVEKPPPEITKGLVIPVLNEPDDEEGGASQRGRKRAVDFL